MNKMYAALLGAAVGYVLVVLCFILLPPPRPILAALACPSCPVDIMKVGPSWPSYLLFFAPLNALTYGILAIALLFLANRFLPRRR